LWEQSRGREIGRRIAGAEFTEVDHAGERPARDDDIRRMEVTVQPYRQALPIRSRNGLVPDISDSGGDTAGGNGVERAVELMREGSERDAAHRIGWSLGGRRQTERSEEARQSVGRVIVPADQSSVGRFAVYLRSEE
jgi:hypothetical protein